MNFSWLRVLCNLIDGAKLLYFIETKHIIIPKIVLLTTRIIHL